MMARREAASIIRRGVLLAAPGIALLLFPEEVLTGLGFSWALGDEGLATTVLVAIYALNLTVLGVSLRPALLAVVIGRLGKRAHVGAARRFAADMDLEQRNMPKPWTTLRGAWADPARRPALQFYAAFFIVMFGLPIAWAVFVERGVARFVAGTCMEADAWAGRELWVRPSESGLQCARVAGRAGNVAGGALLFAGAVYFRFRFQIFLRGLARSLRRSRSSDAKE
jgi:hypothetical protein